MTVSRLNHSCVPNADHFYDDKSGCQSVFSTRNIDQGEEITIPYIDHSQPRRERQAQLSTWKFTCQCPACDVRHRDSFLHEQRRMRIIKLHQDRCDMVFQAQ